MWHDDLSFVYSRWGRCGCWTLPRMGDYAAPFWPRLTSPEQLPKQLPEQLPAASLPINIRQVQRRQLSNVRPTEKICKGIVNYADTIFSSFENKILWENAKIWNQNFHFQMISNVKKLKDVIRPLSNQIQFNLRK